MVVVVVMAIQTGLAIAVVEAGEKMDLARKEKVRLQSFGVV